MGGPEYENILAALKKFSVVKRKTMKADSAAAHETHHPETEGAAAGKAEDVRGRLRTTERGRKRVKGKRAKARARARGRS